jgi:hypothetical protein
MSKPATTQVLYRELVTPKWTSFLPLALILPTFWLTFAPINTFVGLTSGVLITVAVLLVMIANSPKILIESGQISVGKARIQSKFLGSAESAPAGSRFSQRVPNLDPRAFLALQNSRTGLIKLEILDSKDPTPYWVFSTGNPEAVLKAINLAKQPN